LNEYESHDVDFAKAWFHSCNLESSVEVATLEFTSSNCWGDGSIAIVMKLIRLRCGI